MSWNNFKMLTVFNVASAHVQWDCNKYKVTMQGLFIVKIIIF